MLAAQPKSLGISRNYGAAIVGYTVFSHTVFWGKARELSDA